MKNIKKTLTMCVCCVLIATLAIGGTIAYLTYSDSDVNVMTHGNVQIEQLEYQRADGVSHINAGAVEGDLVPFVQGQTLYPAVPTNNAVEDYTAENGDISKYFYWGEYAPGANGLWNDDLVSNVMDKFVFVKNTGKTDAYYRTIFAFECPEGMRFGMAPDQDGIERELMMNTNSYSAFTWEDLGYTVIDGTRYKLMVANYANVLKPQETSRPSLLQVLLTHNATNEDMELLGNTYDILVVSQAVQTAGFADAKTALNAAFGEITTTNHPWTDGVKVPEVVVDGDSIKDALEEGKDVVLGDDIETPADSSNGYGKTAISVYKGQTLDGASNSFKALQATSTWDSAITAYGGTIKNLTVGQGFRGIFISHITGDQGEKCGLVTFENVVVDGPTYTFNCDQGTNNGLKAIDSTFNGWTSYAATLGNVEFINCDFGEGAGYSFCRPFAPTAFVGCDFEAGYELDPRAAVTFENCTIGGVALTADNLATLVTSNIQNASVK